MVGVDHRFLRALLDQPDKTLPDIVRFAVEQAESKGEDELEGALREGDEDRRIDLEDDLIHIFRHLRRPESLPYFLELIRKEPEDIREEVVQALAELGGPALEPLLKTYEELGKPGEVAFAMAALQVRDQRIVELLVDRFAVDSDDAVLCLALHGDPAAIPALENFLTELGDEDDPAGSLRREVTEAIGKLKDSEPPAQEEFVIWDLYPEEAGPYFDVLTDEECFAFLSSPEPEYRIQAAAAFVLEELPEEVRDKLFEMAQHDPDSRVRASAWEALSGALDDPAISTAMMARAVGPKTHVDERCGAILGLAQHVRDPKIREAIVKLYEDPQTRARGLEAMWRSQDQQFAGYFLKHLKDSDNEVLRQAVLGVGYLGISAAAQELRNYFWNEDLRTDALYAYALSAPVEITQEGVQKLLEELDETAGLDNDEMSLLQTALDDRLELHGLEPLFRDPAEGHHHHGH
jgi:HEAT repeat protein